MRSFIPTATGFLNKMNFTGYLLLPLCFFWMVFVISDKDKSDVGVRSVFFLVFIAVFTHCSTVLYSLFLTESVAKAAHLLQYFRSKSTQSGISSGGFES